MIEQIAGPCSCKWIPALRRSGIGTLGRERTTEPAVQQIGNQQHPVGMVNFPRLHLLMSIELEERIERQQLDAGALVEHLTRNAREDLLHHTICAVVAILERLAE